jgi:RNA polymerase-binding transcription factor DksA
MKTRSQIVSRAKQQLAEVQQIFIDENHWNRCVRKADEAMIDCDPDGQLKRIRAALEKMLAAEKITDFKCAACGAEIQFTGVRWEHVNNSQRHLARLENDV